MNEDQPPAENGCMLWSDGMDLLKDAAERKHLLPTGLEGYSYLECNHFGLVWELSFSKTTVFQYLSI